MMRITKTHPRRIVCFWGEATVRLSTLGWVGLVSFTFSVFGSLLHL